MKSLLTTCLVSVFAASAIAAESTPADQVKAAARSLSAQKNYAWVSTPRSEAASANWRQGPTYGQTEKDGYTYFKFELGDNTIEGAFKGAKRAIKLRDSWESSEELVDDRAWIGERLKAFQSPAGEAEQLAASTTKLEKQADNTLSGSLTEERIKDILLMGRRPETPPKDIKGTVRFWLKDGALTKYEFNVQGKVSGREGQEFEVNRTTTVEVKGTMPTSSPRYNGR